MAICRYLSAVMRESREREPEELVGWVSSSPIVGRMVMCVFGESLDEVVVPTNSMGLGLDCCDGKEFRMGEGDLLFCR